MAVELDVASEEVTKTTNKAINFLNMKVNSMFPFELVKINSCLKESEEKMTINVNLKTRANPGKDFVFELHVNPNGRDPEKFLPSQKQLSP